LTEGDPTQEERGARRAGDGPTLEGVVTAKKGRGDEGTFAWQECGFSIKSSANNGVKKDGGEFCGGAEQNPRDTRRGVGIVCSQPKNNLIREERKRGGRGRPKTIP